MGACGELWEMGTMWNLLAPLRRRADSDLTQKPLCTVTYIEQTREPPTWWKCPSTVMNARRIPHIC